MAKASTGPGQVERCFTILDVLFKHIMHGMANKEISLVTGFTPVQVSRDLDLLLTLRQVEKTQEGRWRPHPSAIGRAVAFQNQIEEYARRGDDFKTRVSAHAARCAQ